MSPECVEFRQSVEKLLGVPSVLKHGIDFGFYLNKTDITQGDMVNTKFTVDPRIYSDVAKMMYPADFFRGMNDAECERFVRDMYDAVVKFKSMIYNYCKNQWVVLYNDIPLKIDLRVGDIFYFGRNEKESILEHLDDPINVYGLDQVIMMTPITFIGDKVTEKIPYGTLVKWMAVLPTNIMSINITYNYFKSHLITMFDMFFGYQIMAKIHVALETEIINNHKPVKGDILVTPDRTYTFDTNSTNRSLQFIHDN